MKMLLYAKTVTQILKNYDFDKMGGGFRMVQKVFNMIFLILLSGIVVGENVSYDNTSLYSTAGGTFVGGNVRVLSGVCQKEVNAYLGQPIGEAVADSVKDTLFRVVLLLFFIIVVWLFEPLFKSLVKEHRYYRSFVFFYKWVGLGLIVMCMIVLLILVGVIK